MQLSPLHTALLRPLMAGFLAVAGVIALSPVAQAVPALQVYIDGAAYDDDEESWKITAPSNEPLRLWVVGNINGNGGKGPLTDVKAAFAYSTGAGNVTLNITPTTTGGVGGFTDPSIADAPTLEEIHTDGSRPVRADGKKLSKHGVYGDNTHWQEWSLGDMSRTDSPIADFMTAFPQAPLEASGQINAYDVSVTGLNEGEWIHIDLYGAYENKRGKTKSVFAPFSHDADFSLLALTDTSEETAAVPEPASALILGPFLGLLMYRRHRRLRRAAV